MDGIFREIGRLDVQTEAVAFLDLPEHRQRFDLQLNLLSGTVRYPRLQESGTVAQRRDGCAHVVGFAGRRHFTKRERKTGIIHIGTDFQQEFDSSGDGHILRQRWRDETEDIGTGADFRLQMTAPASGRRKNGFASCRIDWILRIIIICQFLFLAGFLLSQAVSSCIRFVRRQEKGFRFVRSDRPLVKMDPFILLDDIGQDFRIRQLLFDQQRIKPLELVGRRIEIPCMVHRNVGRRRLETMVPGT